MFLCPECKNLFATFEEKVWEQGVEKVQTVFKEVPLPGCAAFIFQCGTCLCSAGCRNAQQNSTPAFKLPPGGPYPIGTETPAAPVPPGWPGGAPFPNAGLSGWPHITYGTTTGNSAAANSIKIRNNTAAPLPNANKDTFKQGFLETRNALDKYFKDNK